MLGRGAASISVILGWQKSGGTGRTCPNGFPSRSPNTGAVRKRGGTSCAFGSSQSYQTRRMSMNTASQSLIVPRSQAQTCGQRRGRSQQVAARGAAAAMRRRGTSRCAERHHTTNPRRQCAVFQRGEQIVRFEIGVVRQDLIVRHSWSKKLKQVLNRISKSANGRLAVTDGRTGHHALQTRHVMRLRHPPPAAAGFDYRPARCESVPEVGLEPTRPFGQRILSPSRLPFRHSGE